MSRIGSEIYKSDFDEMNFLDDNELVKISRNERESAKGRVAVTVLISRYLRLVRKKAYSFSNDCAEPEDLAQEGLLAFLNAVNSFDPNRGAKFSSFADVCVTNGIRSAVVRFGRNSGESLPEDYSEKADDGSIPENIWVEKEKMSGIYKEIETLLSKKEWEIFRMYLGGLSYKEISEKLDISLKSVDNAVFRVRKKLKMLFPKEKHID